MRRGMLKLLDVLLQLDHLKNAKASIPNDFSWYKRSDSTASQYPILDVHNVEFHVMGHCLKMLCIKGSVYFCGSILERCILCRVHPLSQRLYMCRTFTQVSTQWPDTDGMREELDDLQVVTIWLILMLRAASSRSQLLITCFRMKFFAEYWMLV